MKKEACLKWQMHPVGFEPTLSCKNEILSLTGLPIPPRMRKKEACAKTIFELTLRKFCTAKKKWKNLETTTTERRSAILVLIFKPRTGLEPVPRAVCRRLVNCCLHLYQNAIIRVLPIELPWHRVCSLAW